MKLLTISSCAIISIVLVTIAFQQNAMAQIPKVVEQKSKSTTSPKAGGIPKVLPASGTSEESKGANGKHGQNAINSLNGTKGEPVLGIGFFTDTESNISYQYMIYSFLNNNPIPSKEGKLILPVLTMRRGLPKYYINGLVGRNTLFCTVWKDGEILGKFNCKASAEEDIDDIMTHFYQQLASKIGASGVVGDKLDTRSLHVSYPAVSTVGDNIKFNMMMSAANVIPQLDDYNTVLAAFEKSYSDLNDNDRNFLKSNADLAEDKHKKKSDEYQQYLRLARLQESAENDCRIILPETPALTNEYSNLELAASVGEVYTQKTVTGFFFDSKFVDDKAKSSANSIVFPLFKRPGTVLTYLQAGKNLAHAGFDEQAIQLYLSGLIMIENLNTGPGFKEFLRWQAYNNLISSYNKNKQGASAYLAKIFARLHGGFSNSKVLAGDDKKYKNETDEVVTYFQKIENDAIAARAKKRAATWTAVLTTATAVTSAYADAASGLSTPSATTQVWMQNATNSIGKGYEIKLASLHMTGEAASIFNKAFAELIQQIKSDNNNLSAYKPVFSLDLVQILSNKELATEYKQMILDIGESVPCLRTSLVNYFQDMDDNEKLPSLLKDVYEKLFSLEKKIYGLEASGIPTTEEAILNN